MPCFIWVQDWAILYVIIGKINNMMLCVNFLLIYTCMIINMEVVINGNYM